MGKKKKINKPRNEALHEILVHVKPGKHKTDKRDQTKRSRDRERREELEAY